MKSAGPYGDPTVVKEVTLPATAVAIGMEPAAGGLPGAVISDRVANELGLGPGQNGVYLLRLARPVTEADVAIAAEPASRYANTTAWAGALKPGPAYEGMRILLIVLSLIVAMSITAVAVALGEAEARADQRTLLAVGADPAIRRRITAARAGVLALLAGLLAVPAGLLPAWGLIGSRVNAPFVVPWPEILIAVAVLPLAGIVGGLLLTRPIPSWSAFREAAT